MQDVRITTCERGHITKDGPKTELEGGWECSHLGCAAIVAEFTVIRMPSETSTEAAIELAQLSRELVQHSREMRAQEKKIVELEDTIKRFKENKIWMFASAPNNPEAK